MKKALMILVVLAMALMVGNAWAFGNNQAIAGAVGIGVGIGVGTGGDASAKAVSVNENYNKNVNKSSSHSGNKNTIAVTSEGIEQSVVQNYEAKRDHIRGPELIQSRAYFTRSKAFKNKVAGLNHFLDVTNSLSISKARRACSKADDIEIEPVIFFENNFSTNEIQTGASGELMAYLYINQDGPDINVVAAFCQGAVNAMRLGATHVQVVYQGQGEVSGGSSWNIGIGGGASVMRSGDDIAIAPNGGLGYGRARAFNEARPALTLAVYFDADWLLKYDVKIWKDGYDVVDTEDGP